MNDHIPASKHAASAPLYVIVSLDVEEEGLFSGRYAKTGCGVTNVPLLSRLRPLTEELGFPLTLLCSYTVFQDKTAQQTLSTLRDSCGAEIGAHLHHWSTPPVLGDDDSTPQSSHLLDQNTLRQKLHNLLEAGRLFQGAPLTSFRMGRWDLKGQLRPLLFEQGIRVDSSVCPLRCFHNGPDHFLAPADPYWVNDDDHSPLLEAPITQVPLLPSLARCWYARRSTSSKRDQFRQWGALSPNPYWHNALIMRQATRLHRRRGGQVLSLFWHSSEMMPKGSPHVPDQAAADAMLRKIYDFLSWLRRTHSVKGITLSQLRDLPQETFIQRPEGSGDW